MTEDPTKGLATAKETTPEPAESDLEQERHEMNEGCFVEMKQTIDRVRNAWQLAEKGAQEKIKNMCKYQARQYEIFLELLQEQDDITRGYTKLNDNISGNNKTREHTKRFDEEFVAEFNRRVSEEFKWDQELAKDETGLSYHKKTNLRSKEGQVLFTKDGWDNSAYDFGYSNSDRFYESSGGLSDEQKKVKERGINRFDYNLGHNLEKTLGGAGVSIGIDENRILARIIEKIQFESASKKYSIDPETKVNGNIGRLVVPDEMIPTISDIKLSENWRDYYQE